MCCFWVGKVRLINRKSVMPMKMSMSAQRNRTIVSVYDCVRYGYVCVREWFLNTYRFRCMSVEEVLVGLGQPEVYIL